MTLRMRTGLRAIVAALALSCHHHAATAREDAAADAAKVSRPDAGAAPRPEPDAAPSAAEDALPPFTSEELTTRGRHLLEAIQKDQPELAADIVFPRDGYIAVKDVPDPGKHWDQKVLAAFKSQVHLLHRRTKGVERATFTSFELGQPASEALAKKHDLKRMLWRSRHSRIGFVVDGRPSHIEILEMTAWRGAWYLTKLR